VKYLSESGRQLATQPPAVTRTQQAQATNRVDAQRALDEIMHAPASHPYWDGRSPDHRAAVAAVERLSGIVHGTRQVDQPGVDVTVARPRGATDGAVHAASEALRAQRIMDEWLAAGPMHPLRARNHPEHAAAKATSSSSRRSWRERRASLAWPR
jgi:hypothetical protein